jgi:hypothetical protein
MIPQLLLVLVCLTACGWPLGLYCSLAGLPIGLFVVGAVLGGMSALGLARWGERLPLGLWMIILACLLYAEYQWLRIMTGTAASGSDRIVAQVGLYACLALSLLHTALSTPRVHSDGQTAYRSRLPSSWWFITKLFRSRGIIRGMILTSCMSLGSVLLCRRLGISSPDIYSSLAALLGAAVAADMRLPMRHTRTPESHALKGSFYVVRTVCTGGLAVSIGAISPLLWALQEINAPPLAYVPVATGIIVGLSASIILAPASRDISSQCSSSLLALGCIAGIPQLVPATTSRLSVYGALLVILIPLACIAEYKRNPYYWRAHA